MAKGVEDTAFYRYVRLLALNEVGGDPGPLRHRASRQFHARERAARGALPATPARRRRRTTRSAAPTCARGSARSRAWPSAGASTSSRWHELNATLRDGEAPDWTEELFVYQTLVGAWPIEPERLEPYLEKALREAKRNTSWVEPNERVGGAR